MAYDPHALKRLVGERGEFSIWHYRSVDGVAAVRAADYITDAFRRAMTPGDLVIVQEVHASTGVIEATQLMVVLTVDTDGADLTDGTAVVLTNT